MHARRVDRGGPNWYARKAPDDTVGEIVQSERVGREVGWDDSHHHHLRRRVVAKSHENSHEKNYEHDRHGCAFHAVADAVRRRLCVSGAVARTQRTVVVSARHSVITLAARVAAVEVLVAFLTHGIESVDA